jgi:BMFP domain-containing protein YqiC
MTTNPKFPSPAFINDLVAKLGDVLAQSPARDIEQNLKAGVTSMLGKLDLVTREEFDVQTEVLARTREKLAQLEARLLELEKAGVPGAHEAEPEKQPRTED